MWDLVRKQKVSYAGLLKIGPGQKLQVNEKIKIEH